MRGLVISSFAYYSPPRQTTDSAVMGAWNVRYKTVGIIRAQFIWTMGHPHYFPFITQQYGKDAERIMIVFIFGSRIEYGQVCRYKINVLSSRYYTSIYLWSRGRKSIIRFAYYAIVLLLFINNILLIDLCKNAMCWSSRTLNGSTLQTMTMLTFIYSR